MEEKKKRTHQSSGAEKVEKITQEEAEKPVKSVKTPEKKRGAKKQPQKMTQAEKKERVQAEKRVEIAKAKAEKKQLKAQKKAEVKKMRAERRAEQQEARAKKRAQMKASQEERRAQLKAKRAERRAEKIARREMLKNESQAQKKRRLEREKKEKIALRRQRQEAREKALLERRKQREEKNKRRAEERNRKRAERSENRKRAPGYGGWLAATISLGVVTLALATVVTSNLFQMNDMNEMAGNGFRATMYEMVSASEDMDRNLSKLRVSGGASEQRKLLTEILVDTALLESAVERCPVDMATSTEVSRFVNMTGAFARRALQKLALGTPLNEQEKGLLNHLYEVNANLSKELNSMCVSMIEEDVMNFVKGKECDMAKKFQEMGEKMRGEPDKKGYVPGENVGENQLTKAEEISSARAEELVKKYLANYHVKQATYTGETVSRSLACYNFNVMTEGDVEVFAQISKKGGKLVFFDSYEPCTQKNFDLQTCDNLARDFLASLGIENVEAVFVSESGTIADITYVAIEDGVRVYPDMVRIRVCESKGKIVGMDAHGYLTNHTARRLNAGISCDVAEAKLVAGLEVRDRSLAVIPVGGKEVLCYEFNCLYGEEEFILYLNADNGEEMQIYCVQDSKQGRFLR